METAARKAMRVGRATVFLVGLAIILALAVGLASTALAGTGVGARLDLGRTNAVNAVTTLVGSVAGPSLRVDNNSAGSGATALDLRVEPGKAPLKIDSDARVANLNADKVDGKDSGAFVLDGATAVFASGQTRSDGTIRNSVGAVSAATHSQTGFYCVDFSETAEPERLESTVVGLAGSAFEGRDFPRVVNGTGIPNPCDSDELTIQVTDAAGTPTDTRFSFVVP
jgi:hypothetical protein